jgi:hypothetical protein
MTSGTYTAQATSSRLLLQGVSSPKALALAANSAAAGEMTRLPSVQIPFATGTAITDI